MLKISKGLLIGALSFVTACAAINVAKLSSDTPEEAVIEVQNLRNDLRDRQVDLLAKSEFSKGDTRLENAVKNLNRDDNADLLKKLSQSKAYFLKAENIANSRSVVPDRLLTAREVALKSGVRESQILIQRLEEIDDSFRSKSANFSKKLPVERLSKIEIDYLNLEVSSVQNKHLSLFRETVNYARKNNASKKSPKTYRRASNDLKAAENMIQQSPRNEENYRPSVAVAEDSSKLLREVMKKLKGVARGASEDAALELVYQERKLAFLSDRTSFLQSSLERTESKLDNVSHELQSKTWEAKNSKQKVLLQAAMNDIQRYFTPEEAQVYQQGRNIIIRLQNIDFKSGSAMIPGKSMNLLSRINSAITTLHSSTVVIEGHTDSTGRRDDNHDLSIKRSRSVARYLESLDSSYKVSSIGFGESQPIANNQTKIGRAMNRRVDIVVTATNL